MKKSSARLSLIACLLIVAALHFLSLPTLSLSSGSNINVVFEFDDVLQINVSDTEMLIENIEPGTRENTNEIDVNVITNSETGFTLDAVIGERLRPSTNIQSIVSDRAFFSSIGLAKSIELLPAGTWGYSINHGATFSGLPDYSDDYLTEPLLTTETVSDETIPFLVGASAAEDQPRGIYYAPITFRAVANRHISTIDKILYMQDIDEVTVATMERFEQYQVIDERDGKEYFITKLRDGNVWMTQNLDFDLYDGITLNPETSDVDSEITLAITPTGNDYDTSDKYYYHNLYMYDPGDLYCPGGYCNSKDGPQQTSDLSATDENLHYSFGNLYSFWAATANYFPQCTRNQSSTEYGNCMSQLSSMNTVDAETSICPKGWGLPASLASKNMSNRVILNDLINGAVGIGRTYSSSIQLGAQLWRNPLYLGSSPYGYGTNTTQYLPPNNGNNTYLWTSTISGPTYAFYQYSWLSGDSETGNVSYGYYYGYTNTNSAYNLYPIRCYAKPPRYNIQLYMNDGLDENEQPYDTITSTFTWNSTYKITVDEPSRSGYTFIGWGTSPSTVNPLFLPGQEIELNQHNVRLYALWQEGTSGGGEVGDSNSFADVLSRAGKQRVDGYYLMQDVDSEICDAVDVGSKIKLKDSRDGKLYTVVKYDLSGTNSFGACWMYDHLALGKPTEFTTLTPDDSDVTENFSLPPTVATWPNNMNTLFAWINISSTDEQGYLYSANTATANSMATVVGSSDYPVDNYYVASQSICPKNWTLPRSYYVTGDQSFNTEKALWDAVQPTNLTSSSYYSYGSSYDADAKIKSFYSLFIPSFYGYIYSTNTYIENNGRATNYWTKDFVKSNEGTNNYQSTYYTYHYKNGNNLEMYASYSDTWKSGHSVKCMIPVSYTKKSYYINYYVSQYPGYTQSATDRVSMRSDEPQEYTIRAPGSITVKRAGYRLVGWSTTSDATTAEYANGGVYTFPENSSSLNLYSVWEQISEDTPVTFDEAFEAAGKEKYNGYYKMQDITPEICDAVANGQSGRLIDVRDDKVYWVARLTSLYDDNHDGVCWMTQNLNFHLSTEGTALSPETSDVLKAKVFHAATTSGNPKSALNADDYYLDYGGLTFQNTEYQNMSYLERTKNVSELEVDDVRWHYSIGTYYGLAAAYVQDDYSNYMNFPLPEDREESVCPKGWQIPNALASGTSYYTSVQFPKSRSFLELNYNLQSMNGAYNEKHFQDPFYATASGYLSSSVDYTFEEMLTHSYFNSYGYAPYYWTGNMYSSNYAYIVNMYSGTRDSDLEDYRMRYYSGINSSDYSPYYNMSIRCVARF